MPSGVNSIMNELYAVKAGSIWATLKGERASFWLICFYLFLEYVRPQSVYPEIDILPYAFISVVLAFVAYVLEAEHQSVKNVENKLIVLFLVAILVSSVLAYSPSDSYANLKLFLTWFVIYFLIIHIVNTEQRYFIFLLSFLIYNFKMSQHGFLTWAQRGFSFRSWGVTGAPGWFQNSGEFGIELCIFIPLSIYFIISLRQYWGKLKLMVFALFPFTAIASVIATSSRGALVGAVVALAWMVAKSKAKIISFVSVAMILLIAYSFIPPESYERLQSSGEDNTSVIRLTVWKAGLEMMDKYPAFGIGYENWTTYYSNFYTVPEQLSFLPHNIFIQAGAELGYTGLSIFCLMILFTFVNNYRTRKLALTIDNKFMFYTAHGLDAALIGFMVSGSFVTVLYYPYFWINMAFTVALNNIAKLEQSRITLATTE
jgi:probable O-glycosylation ligase (exosortase A-associated)